MTTSHLEGIPDELIEAIVLHLPAPETLAFGATCKRCNKIAYEHLIWRRHCVQEWRYWEPAHELQEKLRLPPARTKWRLLYNERRKTDKKALDTFNDMLKTQQNRIAKFEKITELGYDVKDLTLSLRDHTPDDAEDVLARRYYADAALGQIHRMTALEKWSRLQKRQMVKLEEVLGAYDLFVLAGGKGDLGDIDKELDRLANEIRTRDADFDSLSVRRKAVEVAKYLREHNLVGNPSEDDYHALRNNFISIALFDDVHTSLPLQSVAIYCSVARRLGVDAKPSNYPAHVHAVIQAPDDATLDGVERTPNRDSEPEIMHMDPWRSSEEIPRDHLTLRLTQMGAPIAQHAYHLGSTNNMEVALRTGRNIMNSVQQLRERQRGTNRAPEYPDVEGAWYGMLWSMMILGDNNQAATLHRRRQCLPYLADHYQSHFPEDLGLIEKIIAPMFVNEREAHVLIHLITTSRAADQNQKPPNPRPATDVVEFKVGQLFRHKRFNYEGFIIGWDKKCEQDPRWMQQMHVDDLPRGREQPFYNVMYATIADDKTQRYVAEENIIVLDSEPCDSLMKLAGRYFKRWDQEKKVFVSNVRDEYPDD